MKKQNKPKTQATRRARTARSTAPRRLKLSGETVVVMGEHELSDIAAGLEPTTVSVTVTVK
jgi:hypothetical protein